MKTHLKGNISVYFVNQRFRQRRGLSEENRLTAILEPNLNWKNGARFNLTVLGATKTTIDQVPILLAFQKPAEKTSRGRRPRGAAYEVEDKLRGRAEGFIGVEEFSTFFTLIPNLEGYRAIVRALGPAGAKHMFIALNEIVTAGQGLKKPDWYLSAVAGNVIDTVFLRDSEAFFAFHNAAPILRGLKFEKLDSISSSFKLSFKLATFENNHKLEFAFDFGKFFGNRISVVIGKNGVGKSQTLFQFAKSLISGSKLLTDGSGNRPHVNRLIAVTSPGETRNTFPTMKWASRIDYRRLHLARSQRGKSGLGVGSTLVQLARSDEGIKDRKRWGIFIESISAIHKPDELFIKRRAQKKSDRYPAETNAPFPVKEMLKGDENERLERWSSVCPKSDLCRYVNGNEIALSSGQVTFIRFAAQACLHVENGSVLLFDEPETHLHPNLITEFVRLLARLLEITGSVAIMATHSAYFVREVPREQVIVLKQTDSNISMVEAIQPRLRTLGADIGEISHFVFGDELFGPLLGKVKEEIIKNQANAVNLLKSIEEDLSVEAWMNLNRLVPRKEKK